MARAHDWAQCPLLSRAFLLEQEKNADSQEKVLPDSISLHETLVWAVRSDKLKAGKEELENRLVKSYWDALRNIPLNKIDGLANPRKFMVAFNVKQPASRRSKLWWERLAASQPLVQTKYCTWSINGARVFKSLHQLLQAAWRQKCIYKKWTNVKRMIPKEFQASLYA